jgi:putative transposase
MRPSREHATNYGQTYMVTSETWGRRALFRAEPWARLLIERLYHYRGSAYLLHAFVIMPDHIHVLLSPTTSLEKAVQFIKGGFSYRTRKELGSNIEVWQKGFSDHRIRDAEDYAQHVVYIHENPIRKHLCDMSEQYLYSSAHCGFELDEVPEGLKPPGLRLTLGAPEGAPLQNKPGQVGSAEGAPLQNKVKDGGAGKGEALPIKSKQPGTMEGTPFQNKVERAGVATGTPKSAPRQSLNNTKDVA